MITFPSSVFWLHQILETVAFLHRGYFS